MFDGSFETFERLRRVPTADIIATVGNRIITLTQEQPLKPRYPSLPGGAIGSRERPLAAAKRELLEETGYVSDNWTLVAEYFGSSKMYFHEYQYVARDCRKVAPQTLDSGEKIFVRLLSFDKLLKLCRNRRFTAPLPLIFEMYEALVDPKQKRALKKKIFGA